MPPNTLRKFKFIFHACDFNVVCLSIQRRLFSHLSTMHYSCIQQVEKVLPFVPLQFPRDKTSLRNSHVFHEVQKSNFKKKIPGLTTKPTNYLKFDYITV